jgi:N-methylhydantoinase B
MTNTLNTPVEALEHAYPLRVEEYALREGSGGRGKHRGGEGVIRRVRVLVPAQFGLLTERRKSAPRGSDGGGPGAVGVNLRRGEALDAKCSGTLDPGDTIELQTPGGGGFGR